MEIDEVATPSASAPAPSTATTMTPDVADDVLASFTRRPADTSGKSLSTNNLPANLDDIHLPDQDYAVPHISDAHAATDRMLSDIIRSHSSATAFGTTTGGGSSNSSSSSSSSSSGASSAYIPLDMIDGELNESQQRGAVSASRDMLWHSVDAMVPPPESSDFIKIYQWCDVTKRSDTCRQNIPPTLRTNFFEPISLSYMADQLREPVFKYGELPCSRGVKCIAVDFYGLVHPLMQYQSKSVQGQFSILIESKQPLTHDTISTIYKSGPPVQLCVLCILHAESELFNHRLFDYKSPAIANGCSSSSSSSASNAGTVATVDGRFIPQHYQIFYLLVNTPGEIDAQYCIPATVTGKNSSVIGPLPAFRKDMFIKGRRMCKWDNAYYDGVLMSDDLLCKPSYSSSTIRSTAGDVLQGFH